MGSGIDAVRDLSPAHAEAMENMRDQLVIVLLQRLGGEVSVPVEEIDATGNVVVMLKLEGTTFKFSVKAKQ